VRTCFTFFLVENIENTFDLEPILEKLSEQNQLDEVVRWLSSKKLTKTVNTLLEEYFNSENVAAKPEIKPTPVPIKNFQFFVQNLSTLLSVRCHPNRPFVMHADSSKKISVLNIQNGEVLTSDRENNPFLGSVISIDFHPTLDFVLISTMCEHHALLSISPDGKSLKTLQKWKLHTKYVVRVKWSPDGLFFATASHDRSVGVYSFEPETRKVEFLKQLFFSGAVEAIQFTKDTKQIIIAHRDDPNLRYVNMDDWSVIKYNMNALGDQHVGFTPLEIVLSPDGQHLAVCTDKSSAILFKTGTPYQAKIFYGFKNDEFSQPRATFDSSGLFYITSQDGKVYVFDIDSEKPLCFLDAHKALVRDVAFHKQTDTLVSVSYDKTCKFWKK